MNKDIEAEELLELNDPEYVRSIKQARKEAREGKVYTLDEVFSDL